MSDHLFTTDRAVVEQFAADLDAACGYPNPATMTERAVAIQEVEGGFIVPVPDGVWAPKLNQALNAKSTLPADRKNDVPAATKAEASTKAKDLKDTGKASGKQNFVLVSKAAAEEIREAVKLPIALSGGDSIPDKKK